MANKTLTAKVDINVSQATKKIDSLIKKINQINEVVNKPSGTSGLEKKITKALLQQEKLKQATAKTQLAEEKVTTQKNKSAVAAQKVNEATTKTQIAEQRLALQTERTKYGIERINTLKSQVASKSTTIASRVAAWAKNQQAVNSSMLSTNSILSSITGKLKMLASTYLGIMGMKAAIGASDTLTSTQNKLNNLNGGDTKLTQNQLDKMYVSANKVRMLYTDMAKNTSKSMVLAGEAFQGNLDNAIRFQEIMAETYALGGASAEEMSSSMYQLIQALGSGTLAGDELRSVREGAPLAYKAIEEFAQGVYNSNESLKEMASQGKITSDMVVAAMMNAGDKIDKQFEQTAMTFSQAWDRIRNIAVKAFEPVSEKLNEMLNKAAENGAFEKIEQALLNLSKAVQIAFAVIESSIGWVADRWEWFKNLMVAGLLILAAMWTYKLGTAIANVIAKLMSFSQVQWTLLIVAAAVLVLIYDFYLWKTSAVDTCNAIVIALATVGAALLIIGLIFGSVELMIAGGIVLLLGVIFYFFEAVCSGVAFVAAVIWNIVWGVISAIVGLVVFLVGVIIDILLWLGAMILNIAIANINAVLQIIWCFVEPFLAIIEFILNACNGGFNSFGGAVANLIGQIISWFLSLGKVVTKIIDAIFGTNWSAGLSALQNEVISWGKNEQGITINREPPEIPRIDAGDAGSTVNPTEWLDGTWAFMDGGFADPSNWSDSAGNWGANIKDIINQWGSQYQGDFDISSLLDEIGKKFGLDFGDGLPDGSDYDSSGAYNSNLEDLLNNILGNDVGDISDNTDSIADSMELTEEDLEYLRKLADLEWKKEFTTANITVDMSNYNTINSDEDLDGIVDKLSDKLREELNAVANGTYA